MSLKLFILFLVVPIAEIYLLIKVGGQIGPWPTVGLIFATGVAGAILSKTQSARTMARAQKAMLEGSPPADAVMDGLLMVIAGALLIIPGFITDALGLVLLIPPVRAAMRQRVAGALVNRAMAGGAAGAGGAWADDETVIDAEVIDDESETSGGPPQRSLG